MEYSFFELVTKAYPIIRDNGYIKGETTEFIKNNYDNLSEKISFVEVEDFVNWVEEKAKNKNSSYLDSVMKLRLNKTVNENELNLLLSALGFYFKDKAAQKERDNNPSEFVGNIGDIITFTVKDMKAISSNVYSYYGPETIFWRIVGTDNNLYMWSTAIGFESGDTITAKVKDHRNYKGEKQTVITRGKVKHNSELPDDDLEYTGKLLNKIY